MLSQTHLTPADAGAIANRARALLRTGQITHHTFAVLDALLWSCRDRVSGRIVASYATLQRLAHCARNTVADALAALEGLGVLTRIKRRVKGAWHQGGLWSRALANAFILHVPHTESARQPKASRIQEIYLAVVPSNAAAASREVLARIARERQAVLAAQWLARRK